jgi:hypothetical protein
MLATPEITWSVDTFDVPLGSDIYDYAYLPTAHLWVNGAEVFDENSYIEYGVNHTTLHVISTNYLNAYHIYYRAYFPSYDLASVHEITFNIVDITPPVCTKVEPITIILGTTLSSVNYLNYIAFSDNYDPLKDLRVSVFGTTNIKNNNIGAYPITYHIVDTSNNYLDVESVVYVIDNIAPSIRVIKDLMINVNSHPNLLTFFDIKDNYDTVLDITLDDTLVNYTQIGNYLISILAKDKSGNTSFETFSIWVRDLEAPNLILISSEPKINVFDEEALNNLQIYIIYLSDNYATLSEITLEITHNININVPGKYEIYYQATDPFNNRSSKTLKVSVADLEAPICWLITDLTFEVFSEEPVWYFYFGYLDNYSMLSEIETTFSEKVDMKKIGIYQLVVNLSDSAKNKASFIFLVAIIDSTPAEVIQRSELIVFDFMRHNFIFYFDIKDNYDKEFIITYDDSQVDYSVVGEYEYHLFVQDKSGNMSDFLTSVFVIDNELPTITLKTDTLYISVFDDEIDLYSNIKKIDDNYSLDEINLEISSNFIAHQIGLYQATYLLQDSSSNYTTKVLLIYVYDDTLPVFKGKDYIQIKRNSHFSIMNDLVVNDPWDGDLSHKIVAYPSSIDTSKLGFHNITYFVLDESGNAAYFKRVVEVQDSFNFNALNTIPFILAFSGLAVGLYFFMKKHKHH